MGRISTLLEVGAYLKIAATVAVALLAFGAMASPAWAQGVPSQLGLKCEPNTGNAQIGQEVTFTCTVSNLENTEAFDVLFSAEFVLEDVQLAPGSFSVSTTKVAPCTVIPNNNEPPLPATWVAGCALGDLSPREETVVTIKFVPTTSGTISYEAFAQANIQQPTTVSGQLVVDPLAGEDNGERVLVDHKGKELCLPRAALNGHLNHGDEVISEEGCSNAAGAKNGKQ